MEDGEIQESARNAPERSSRSVVTTFRIGLTDPARAVKKNAVIDAEFSHEQGSLKVSSRRENLHQNGSQRTGFDPVRNLHGNVRILPRWTQASSIRFQTIRPPASVPQGGWAGQKSRGPAGPSDDSLVPWWGGCQGLVPHEEWSRSEA